MNIEQTKEAIAVMQAYVDGKEIEARYPNWNGEGWHAVGAPIWDWDIYCYRVKPAEPKKLKIEAWLSPAGYVDFAQAGSMACGDYKAQNFRRIPSLDTEVEVME